MFLVCQGWRCHGMSAGRRADIRSHATLDRLASTRTSTTHSVTTNNGHKQKHRNNPHTRSCAAAWPPYRVYSPTSLPLVPICPPLPSKRRAQPVRTRMLLFNFLPTSDNRPAGSPSLGGCDDFHTVFFCTLTILRIFSPFVD